MKKNEKNVTESREMKDAKEFAEMYGKLDAIGKIQVRCYMEGVASVNKISKPKEVATA